MGVGSRVVDSAGTPGEIVARNSAWLTMRTDAGEVRSVRKVDLELISVGEAGEVGEAGDGVVQATPAAAEEPEPLTGRRVKKRFVGSGVHFGTVEGQEEGGGYFVRFDDGDELTLSEAQLLKVLLPAATEAAEAVKVAKVAEVAEVAKVAEVAEAAVVAEEAVAAEMAEEAEAEVEVEDEAETEAEAEEEVDENGDGDGVGLATAEEEAETEAEEEEEAEAEGEGGGLGEGAAEGEGGFESTEETDKALCAEVFADIITDTYVHDTYRYIHTH